jgi:hypothetical protein
MYKLTECKNPHYFFSWGKGLQSTCLGVMAVQGLVKKPEAIITAETGWEHPHTYITQEYYKKYFEDNGIPVYIVQSSSIKEDRNKRKQGHLPLWTGDTGGPLHRECTYYYKIKPVRNKLRELCGLRLDNKGRTLKNTVFLSLGISFDEAERMKDSDRTWIKNEYPLVDMKFSREDCANYLSNLGLPVPLKSSCMICPYKDTKSWEFTKLNYPKDFKEACEFDEEIREAPQAMKDKGYTFKLFLYKKCIPISEADFSTEIKEKEDICDAGYCFV